MRLSPAQCQLLGVEEGKATGDLHRVWSQKNPLIIEPQKFDEKILQNQFLGKNMKKLTVQVVVRDSHMHRQNLTVMKISVIMIFCQSCNQYFHWGGTA